MHSHQLVKKHPQLPCHCYDTRTLYHFFSIIYVQIQFKTHTTFINKNIERWAASEAGYAIRNIAVDMDIGL